MKVKIGDLTNIRTGKLDANASSEDGQYPFFTCSKDPLKISTYTYDCECVLVAGNGDLNVKYYKGKFDAYQRTYIIEDNGNGRLYMPYLYYFMTRYVEQLRKQAIGGVIKYIKLGNLTNAEMELPTIEEQKIIVNIMEKAKHILDMKNQNIHNLNQLIQSRFVEMFGDPIINDKEWNTWRLEEVCKKIVDCPHSTPSYTTENTGFMCIRTSIVKKNKILWDDIEYISEDEFIKRTQRKKPEIGDIVYTREGAILGIAAIIDREYNVALGQRAMLLSPNHDKCVSEFLCVAMNRDSFLNNVLRGISGSASPHINVGDIRNFKMIIPPINLQNQFAAFVQQVNKSKFAIIKFLYCFIDNKQSIIKPRPNTKESGKIRGGKPHADEF